MLNKKSYNHQSNINNPKYKLHFIAKDNYHECIYKLIAFVHFGIAQTFLKL